MQFWLRVYSLFIRRRHMCIWNRKGRSFYPIDRDYGGSAMFVEGDCFLIAIQDTIRTFVWSFEGFSYSVDAEPNKFIFFNRDSAGLVGRFMVVYSFGKMLKIDLSHMLDQSLDELVLFASREIFRFEIHVRSKQGSASKGSYRRERGFIGNTTES